MCKHRVKCSSPGRVCSVYLLPGLVSYLSVVSAGHCHPRAVPGTGKGSPGQAGQWRGGTGTIQERGSRGCWAVGRAPGHGQGAKSANQSWELVLQLQLAGVWGGMPLEQQQELGWGSRKGLSFCSGVILQPRGIPGIPKGWVSQVWGFLWVKQPQCPPSSSSSSSPSPVLALDLQSGLSAMSWTVKQLKRSQKQHQLSDPTEEPPSRAPAVT